MNKIFYNLLGLLILCLGLTACAWHPFAAQVIVNEPFNPEQYHYGLYVKINIHGPVDPGIYGDMLMDRFRALGFFDKVVTKEPTIYINKCVRQPVNYPKGCNWYDFEDPYTIGQLKCLHPYYLIAEATLRNLKGCNFDNCGDDSYSFELKFINPSNGKVVFYARKIASRGSRFARSHYNDSGYLAQIDAVLMAADLWLRMTSRPIAEYQEVCSKAGFPVELRK